jgi:NAD(P)-dependent dehydrogenase (short-subunit alcohol dehydrogenase family)
MASTTASNLIGKVALVSGGAAGIGLSAAKELGRVGSKVVIADIDTVTGKEAARSIDADFVEADVSTEAGVGAMFANIESRGGALDILVNNAGGATDPHFPDAPFEHWSRSIDLNLRGPMLASQLAVPLMARRGGGAIINVASIAGLGWGAHPSPEYAAAKAGLVRLTSALVPLKERFGIRVHCVCPDWVDTPSSRQNRSKMSPAELAALPPILAPVQVARVIVALAEDLDSTGRVIVLRGGLPPRVLPAADWKSL